MSISCNKYPQCVCENLIHCSESSKTLLELIDGENNETKQLLRHLEAESVEYEKRLEDKKYVRESSGKNRNRMKHLTPKKKKRK